MISCHGIAFANTIGEYNVLKPDRYEDDCCNIKTIMEGARIDQESQILAVLSLLLCSRAVPRHGDEAFYIS